MTPQRWREVEDIYQSAVDMEPDSRGAFLAKVCKGDEELRREVESLLELDNLPQLIDKPAWDVAPELLDDQAELVPGTELGPYRIDEILGVGGMGKVYRATDTRLGRSVAVKLSRVEFSKRFEREARVIASLNHPNICTLFDVGSNYLVMELVEGITLSERIKEGPVPLEEALDISRQIIAALAAAHEKGVVHRDLKPGNIKIKPDGAVKVLDFGLAKLGGTPTVHLEDSPTISSVSTQAGLILGTAAYVSPEQARGKPADKRADIWAFGVVLYEMLTSRQLFGRDTISDTLAAVLKEESQWDRVPDKVQRLLRSCLQKNPDNRLRDIGDAGLLLEDAPPAKVIKRPWLAWSLAAVLFSILAPLAFLRFGRTAEIPAEPVRFEVLLPGKTETPAFAMSPNGRYLAFVAAGSDQVRRLWIRALDSVEARPIAGTEITRGDFRHVPFWSPESRYVAFDSGRRLKKVDLSTGLVQTVCDVPGDVGGGSWNRDGVILFGVDEPSGGLMRVKAAGGSPSSAINPGPRAVRYLFPTFLPDGKRFLFRRQGPPEGIYVASIDMNPDQRSDRLLEMSDPNTVFFYVPDSVGHAGQVLFARDGILFAQAFEAGRLRFVGDAVPLTKQASTDEGRPPLFSVSNNGVLVYTGGAGARELVWLDREANVVGHTGIMASTVELSPDTRKVAFSSAGRNSAVWVADVENGAKTQLTLLSGREQDPLWSTDGRIAFTFYPNDGSGYSVYQKGLTGGRNEEPLVRSKLTVASDWSTDGRLLYMSRTPETKADLWVLPSDGGKAFPVVAGPANERYGKFSPDGRWIAYISDETGGDEVYVASSYPPAAAAVAPTGHKWKISSNGGVRVRWRRDGRELFYYSPDGTIMAVTVRPGPAFEAAHPLFRTEAGPFSWDISPDGKRFLVSEPTESQAPPLIVTLNWASLLKN
jgi:Tol biopolymer transport system component/predicted Ser/Thr protein kinase